MKKTTLTLVSLILASVFAAPRVYAQNENRKDNAEIGQNVGSEWGFHLGSFLPNQIDGITEILPMWGLRYGFKTKRGFIEAGADFSKAMGTRFSSLSLGVRGDIPVQSLVGHVSLGLDIHQVIPPDTEHTTYLGGGHVGGGIMALVGGDVWFRTDMKFNFNPGTSLYIGFGFIFRFPEGTDADGGGRPPE
ncbi:MAG: hypothetical protein SGJ18_11100 [Pseudomonadota bacterium]|nr:hypothetical protein [Pseudomonadota bacterium]